MSVRHESVSNDSTDALVIGGGFYGAHVARVLAAAGLAVVVVEREQRLLARASLINQARVHNGYHYPRSILTSRRSRVNYARFIGEYPAAVVDDFTHYYAIGTGGSKVTAAQFVEFCKRIDAPVAPAPESIRALFDARRIDGVFEVRECAFDARALAAAVAAELDAAGVVVELGAVVLHCRSAADGGVRVVWRDGAQAARETRAAFVFNCTYSALNGVLADSGNDRIPIKRELAEMALVRAPDALAGVGVTVMDGPFFSLMPYPPRPGLHTLSHVRYTPHRTWAAASGDPDASEPTDSVARVTRFPHMLRDAERYLPAIRGADYVGSLWEIKALLPRSEVDDSRPILFHESTEVPGLVSVLGAKIDSAYDVGDSVREFLSRSGSRVMGECRPKR